MLIRNFYFRRIILVVPVVRGSALRPLPPKTKEGGPVIARK